MRATLALLVALAAGTMAAPPATTVPADKRSAENIQFGNQQNPPVGLLDDNALPGAFPSSETTEEGQGDNGEATEAAVASKVSEEPVKPPHREDMERDLPPVALASRWQYHGPRALSLYRPRYDGVGLLLPYLGDPYLARRRRSIPVPTVLRPRPRKTPQVPLSVLRFGHRHKRDVVPRGRFPRDVGRDLDLEALQDLDLVEVLSLLARAQQVRPGYPTPARALLSPAPPRFAPQPRLFPDYDDEDGSAGLNLVNHEATPTAPRPVDPVPVRERLWRRSGGYGLSSVPGFKRSSFRANTFQPNQAQDEDVYSLATMLGADRDPVTHRFQHAAM